MSYKNTVKLLASNFVLVWKQLLYLVICMAIFVLGAYLTGQPLVNLLKANGIGADIKNMFAVIYSSPSQFALNLSDVLRRIFTIIFSNFSGYWLSIIGLILLCLILPYILIQISFYNISSIVYQKLSMNMNVGYIQNGLRSFKSGLRFALATIIINIPFLLVTFFLFYCYIMVATTIITSIIGLVALVALLIIVMAIKTALFAGFVGYMVDKDSSAFVAFGKGAFLSLKNFWKLLSMGIIVVLTIILVNSFIAVFTFFSGLFITIPTTFVFLAIYYFVVYFNSTGMRYYLDGNFIYNPTKYTIKKEDYTEVEVPVEQKEIEVTTTKIKKRKLKKTKNKKD